MKFAAGNVVFYIPQDVRRGFKYEQVLVRRCEHCGHKKYKSQVADPKFPAMIEFLKKTAQRVAKKGDGRHEVELPRDARIKTCWGEAEVAILHVVHSGWVDLSMLMRGPMRVG
jgi:hypothetical protein